MSRVSGLRMLFTWTWMSRSASLIASAAYYSEDLRFGYVSTLNTSLVRQRQTVLFLQPDEALAVFAAHRDALAEEG